MTLKARVIPCLDVKDGRVVKGVNFVDLIDAGDPVEAAKAYDAAGADELCFLDITASHEDRDTIFDVVARTAEQCFMPLTVGGGVRRWRHPQTAAGRRRQGVDQHRRGEQSVDPDFVAEAADKFGNQCIVVAIDAKKVSAAGEADRWEIFTHGGRKATGIDAVDFATGAVVDLGRRRDPAHLDGPRRHQGRLRYRADARRRRRSARAGDRLGRRRHARSSGRGHPRRPCQRRARRLDLPFRHLFDRPRPRRTWRRRPADATRLRG
jgi:hypothetical protein